MEIIEVKESQHRKEFIKLPLELYKNDKNWIRPLDKDIEEVFDPKKNKFFRHGRVIRWILTDNGKTIGRVAAFVNDRTANTGDQPTGGMGFFECINSKEAAFKLFDTCKAWLRSQGMEAMDGPINFGERDKWWGLLIDGFTPPTYCMPYNPTYYKDFFEEYGFKIYFEQYTFARKVMGEVAQEYVEIAERLHADPNYDFRHISKKHLEKHAKEFMEVYNDAWGKHPGFKSMTKEQAFNIMKKMKPILDERIIIFGYYKDEPIGFFMMIPELNQIFRHLNGNLNWWGKLKFLYYQWTKECTKMVGVAFGVKKAYQGKGIVPGLVLAAKKIVQVNPRYDEFEMIWIGDFNPSMIRIAEQVGGHKAKTYYTYRKLFDETKEFKRMPILN